MKTLPLLFPALLPSLLLVASTLAADAPSPTAKDLIDKLTGQALAILRDKQLPKPEKTAKIESLAYDNMDFETLARLSLGRNWKTLTDPQPRTEFLAQFKKRVTATYSHITDDYTDEEVAVTASRQEADEDWTVETHVNGTDDRGAEKEIAKVNYRLRQKDGRLKIIDVTIDGVSLVTNYRSQFQEIITNGGVEKLLQTLRDKNAETEK